jgi:adenylylsulfate kinase-like enzyme
MQSFRDRAREMNDKFVEVFVKCPLEECKKRDPKGLYARGEKGEVNDIAGWHQVYEEPRSAEIILDTTLLPPEQCADLVIQTMTDLGFLPKDAVYSEEEAEEVQQRLADLGYL